MLTLTQALQMAGNEYLAGNLAKAERQCRIILTANPDYFDALHLLGVIEAQKGNPASASALYEKALAINPNNADVLCNLGAALHALKRFEDSLTSCDLALSINRNHAEAHCNRGIALHGLKRHKEALACCDRALSIKPDYVHAHCNRGIVLCELHRYQESLASIDRALALNPDNPEALFNRGVVMTALNRNAEAIADYLRATAIYPDYGDAIWNESQCRLLLGDYEAGWRKYEWRWRSQRLGAFQRNFPQPLWLGKEPLQDKTILLHAEQGLGDTLQFCRYVGMVAALGATVILEVQPPLKSLLGRLPGVDTLLAFGEPLPSFDYHCPLLSLPLAFNTRVDSIPASMPYLQCDPQLQSQWQTRLGEKRRPRIGLVWAGNAARQDDQDRSLRLATTLQGIPDGFELCSLQKEIDAVDLVTLENRNDMRHFGAELRDFADTAALTSLMDLVISVDTSVAHLAGGLGKTTWILLPWLGGWRWLLDRDDSPWYPTVRLFRQPQRDDWQGVITPLRQALEAWLAEPGDEPMHTG